MAKKKSGKNKIDSDLDLGGLDDMEDMDFGDLEDINDNREPSKAEVSKELLKEASKGFLDTTIKKTAAKALPDEYSNNYYTAMEYADFAKETLGANKTKVEKSLFRLGKEVKKILPFQSKMLNNFLEKYEADFEEFKSQSEEQMRDASIASNISGIFDKQLEIQKAIESKRSAEDEVSKKQAMSLNEINLDVLTSIDSNVSNQTAFTLQISKEYYKKSLELQYKSYFIQADMLKTMRDYYKGYSLQFDNIVKNTGLPDFVKLKSTEALKEITRTNVIQGIQKQVFNNNEYIENVKKRISGLISEKISNITNGLDNATDILGGVNSAGEMGSGSGKLIGSILAGLGGSTLGEKLSEKISPKIKDKIKDNKTINAGANYLEMLASSPATFFNSMKEKTGKKAEEYADESSPLRFMASKIFSGANELLGAAGPEMKDFEVKKQSILTHNQPAIFDNKVHRSITEVIPMYLAKILNENTNLRYMYKSVNAGKLLSFKEQDDKVYDYESRKLTSAEEFKANIQNSVFKDSNKGEKKLSDMSSNINSLAKSNLEKDPKKNKNDIKILNNKKLQKLFNTYLSKAGEKVDEKNFTYDNLVSDYSKNLDLETLVKENPELVKYLDILKKAELSKNNSLLNDRMLDTKNNYPIVPIKELFKNVSKLAGSKTLNNIKDEVANIISKGFFDFMINRKTELSIETIVSGKCFSNLTDKQFNENKDVIFRFTGEVKSIQVQDDIVRVSSLELLLGVVSRSLKDSVNIDPEVFQTLYEYSPLLQEEGKLRSENLIEERLGKFQDKDLIDNNSLRDLSRVRVRDSNKAGESQAKKNILNYLENSSIGKDLKEYGNIFNNFKNDLDNSDGVRDMGKSVLNLVKATAKQAKESGSKLYKEAESQFDNIGKQLDLLNGKLDEKAKEQLPKIQNNIITELSKSINKIDELIKKETDNKELGIENFNKAKSELESNIDDQSTIFSFNRNIKMFTKGKEIEIKTLEILKKKLISARNSLKDIDVADKNTDIKKFILETKSIFTNLIKEAKETLSTIEAETKQQSEAVAA